MDGKTYNSVFSLVTETSPVLFRACNETEKDGIKSLNEFDGFIYRIAAGGKILVMDGPGGAVIGEYSNVKELFYNSLEYIRDAGL